MPTLRADRPLTRTVKIRTPLEVIACMTAGLDLSGEEQLLPDLDRGIDGMKIAYPSSTWGRGE